MFQTLTKKDLPSILNIFRECFKNNGYYEQIAPFYFEFYLNNKIKKILESALENGGILGYIQDDVITGYIVHFDYQYLTQNTELFDLIFTEEKTSPPYKNNLNNQIDLLGTNIRYLLCVCVSERFRRNKIGSKLLDELINNYNQTIVCDITNMNTINMYNKRNFKLKPLGENYILAYLER